MTSNLCGRVDCSSVEPYLSVVKIVVPKCHMRRESYFNFVSTFCFKIKVDWNTTPGRTKQEMQCETQPRAASSKRACKAQTKKNPVLVEVAALKRQRAIVLSIAFPDF